MKDWAELRGKRAEKLFKKTTEVEFNLILDSITKEEKHRCNPIAYPESGKPQFFATVWTAVTKDMSDAGDSSHGLSGPEIATFIDDLWNATMGARQAQEYRPCW